MVTKSATSWIESDPSETLSTHASFRVTGDALAPALLTELLEARPTLAYAKGEHYSAGRRTGMVAGRTGVWLISTRSEFSTNLDEHLRYLIAYTFRNVGHILEFVSFVERRKLQAEIHLFWHGKPNGVWPEPTERLLRLSSFVSATIVKDFDRDETGEEYRKLGRVYLNSTAVHA